jgi:hypothetical protein
MRIVHDIDSEPQVTVSGSAYAVPRGKKGFNGWRVDGMIAMGKRSLFIEGNAYYVRKALTDFLSAMDCSEKVLREQHPVNEWWEAKEANADDKLRQIVREELLRASGIGRP